jgi:hypothetical protein
MPRYWGSTERGLPALRPVAVSANMGMLLAVGVDLSAPLSPDQAKRLAVHILESGTIMLSPHADDRGNERSVTTQDIENTLRGGVCLPAEWSQR